jgi:peptide/nickel transport system ATP-binding protein
VSSAADEAAPVLEVRALSVHFPTEAGTVRAVEGVSFRLERGERLALVGESGSGKSTLAMALLRLTRPPGRIVAGEILLGGQDLLRLDAEAMRATRLRRIALVPQGAMNALNPVARVERQITDGLEDHGLGEAGTALRERVVRLLDSVGLPERVARMYPHELSGGMKQRVAIAIAIAGGPEVIVADEPTSALDVVVQRQVMQTLGRVQRELGAAVILIGHDMGLVAQFADRLGVMYAGRLVEEGPLAPTMQAPAHPYTRLLIACVPDLRARRGVLTGIPGMQPGLLDLPPGCAFRPRCPDAFGPCADSVPAERPVGPRRRAACHRHGTGVAA